MCNGFELKVLTESFACSANSAVIKNKTAKGAKDAERIICNSFKVKAIAKPFAVPARSAVIKNKTAEGAKDAEV